MRRLMPLVVLSLLALVPIGNSSPTEVCRTTKPEIDGKGWTTSEKFKGGERACVLAFQSEHKTINLHLIVYDAKTNEIVGEDKSNTKFVGDYVGVVWYPPRTGEYKIEVRQSGTEKVKCYVAIK